MTDYSPDLAAARVAAAIVDIALETYRAVSVVRNADLFGAHALPSAILRTESVIELFVRGLVPTAIERARWDWRDDLLPVMIPIIPALYERAFIDGILDARAAGAGDSVDGCDTENYGLGYAVLDDSAESELLRRWYEAGWQCLILVTEGIYSEIETLMRSVIERGVGGARRKRRRRR